MVDIGCNRNQKANQYLQDRLSEHHRDQLILESLICFSVIRKLQFSKNCQSPEAIIERKNIKWYNPAAYFYSSRRYFNSITDVGICGKYLALEWQLGGFYDINFQNQNLKTKELENMKFIETENNYDKLTDLVKRHLREDF